MSTIPLISTKQTITSHLKSLNIKKNIYNTGNPGLVLWQAQTCGGVKPLNGIPTLPHLTIGFLMTIDIKKAIIKKKTAQIHFHPKKPHVIKKMNGNINIDSTIAGSMNDNINIDSTIAGSMNDNINIDSTIAGSMNDNINIDSTIAGSMNVCS